jgi:ribonucleoside-diphosphate reductase alpha chain
MSSSSLSPRADIDEEEHIIIITRNGRKDTLKLDLITKRLKELSNKTPVIKHINVETVTLAVGNSIKSHITTSDIDEHAANVCSSMSLTNPYYGKLAARIAIDNHQKNTMGSFIDKMRLAYCSKDLLGKKVNLINQKFFDFVEHYQNDIQSMIDYNRDFLLEYFGFRTFQMIYSLKINGKPIERPQDTFMRVAISIHMPRTINDDHAECLNNIKEAYDAFSNLYCTHGSPTYFNAGGNFEQSASCFLLGTEDSTKGIMDTAMQSAMISARGGGLGLHIHNWRSKGSIIRGTNGVSSGIVPFVRMYQSVVEAFNQGGKRKGSAALYLHMHHPEIMSFIHLRRNDGAEQLRARDLFYAVWIPDIFMERVKSNGVWSMFDPNDTEDLSNYYGEEYTKKYTELENKQLYKEQTSARKLWGEIIMTNQETGLPYICFSCNANRASNQKNIGVIKSSNLCAEIYEYSDSSETAVCNLASVCLSRFVVDTHDETDLSRELNHTFPKNPKFDFHLLLKYVKCCVKNLNKLIDNSYYPTDPTRKSNLAHRPIGIGVQGLANAYIKMRYPFDSAEARDLNKRIFETMYFAALTASTEQSKKHGPYSTFKLGEGSPLSKGVFHWEFYGLTEDKLSGMWDWQTLRNHIVKFGVRNSLLIALMPTASTSQLMGNNECFEPYTSNVYKRKTMAGEFPVINPYLVNDLYNLKLWDEKIKEYLLMFQGSIKHIEGVPDLLKNLYKTALEIPMGELVQQAIDRQPFVDQGQSLNLYTSSFNTKEFTNLMFQAWQNGLKTGKYYLHTEPAMTPQKFTIDPKKQEEMLAAIKVNPINVGKFDVQKDECDLCGS